MTIPPGSTEGARARVRRATVARAALDAHLELHHDFSRALAVSGSVEEGRLRALQVAAQSLGSAFAAFWEVLPGAEALRLAEHWEETGLRNRGFVARSCELRLEVGHGLPGRVLETREACWISRASTDGNFPRALEAAEAGLVSGFGVGVCSDDRIVGVLEFFSRQPRPRDDRLLSVMVALGNSLGQFIVRKQAEAALHESEALKAAILDSAADAIITLDRDDTVIEFNDAAVRLFGVSRDDLLGRPVPGISVTPELRSAVDQGGAEAGAERQEGVVRLPDGTTADVELTLTRVARAGAPIYTVYVRDISRAKRFVAEQAFLAKVSDEVSHSLDAQETLHLIAMLAVPFLADQAVVDVLLNDGAIERVAVTRGDEPRPEVPSRPVHYAAGYRSDDPRRAVARDGRPLLIPEMSPELGHVFASDVAHLEVTKSTGPTSCIVVPLRARGATLAVLTLVAREPRRYEPHDLELAEEVAHRVAFAVSNARLFAEAQRTAEEMRRLAQAKDEFLGLVSHELRTPLTTILGNASTLGRHWKRFDKEQLTQALEDIETEGRRLAALVENMLALSRLETTGEVEPEPVLLQRLIPQIIASHGGRFPGREVAVNLPSELPPVAAVPDLLSQVVLNLVSNAHKYSPEGNPVEIGAAAEEEAVRVAVRDHGPGIAPEDVEHIFEPFFRSRRTASRASGAGLGLAVTRRLVELQGGHVEVMTPPGGGTAMTFTLPVQE